MKIVWQVAVFVVLVGVILTVMNVRFIKRHPRVVACRPDQVTAIRIENEGKTLVLERGMSEEDWTVTMGSTRSIAQPDVAQTMAIQVCFIPYVEEFSDLTAAQIGLESGEPQKRVTITAQETVSVQVGGGTPDGTANYVVSSAAPERIYTMPNSYLKTLFPGYFDLRSHYPLQHLKDGTLTIRFHGLVLKLIHGPVGVRAENDAIPPEAAKSLFEAITAWYVGNYHLNPSDAERYSLGVFEPDATLEWLPRNGSPETYPLIVANQRYYVTTMVDAESALLLLEPAGPKKVITELEQILLSRTASTATGSGR